MKASEHRNELRMAKKYLATLPKRDRYTRRPCRIKPISAQKFIDLFVRPWL